MLLRGCAKRCARCGRGRLYVGWFRMRDRCPRCGVQFEREEGFFTGALLINFAVTEGFVFAGLMIYILVLANASGAVSIAPVIIGGVALAVLAPIVFYPFSRTIWFAIHLAMAPLEPHEIESAAHAIDAQAPAGDADKRS
ncbi:MAG: hypothetical protein JWN46_3106 [Acidimicrobiales bacterium]|nr:hypothetical protein [Acidimicrobiales bacterium]